MSGNGDYIPREAAEEACLKVARRYPLRFYNGIIAARDAILKLPAADVRPVVRGEWEDVEVTYVADKTTLPFERISSMRCNQCNRYHTEIYYYGNPTEMSHFCPNCGARMNGGQDNV